MSVLIVTDGERHILVDSERDVALAPVFWGDEDPAAFLNWLKHNPVSYQPHDLMSRVDEWRTGKPYEQ